MSHSPLPLVATNSTTPETVSPFGQARAQMPQEARPAQTARSSTPEPFVGDVEPFLVFSRIDILANIRVLINQRVRATVYFDQNEDFLVTRILSMNPEFEELIFDMAMEQRTNEKLLASSGLTVVAFVDSIKVQFSLQSRRSGLLETVASGRISWRGADTCPVYSEHRGREIRPRSRFLEVPTFHERQERETTASRRRQDYAFA